jgi:hypothetical protein
VTPSSLRSPGAPLAGRPRVDPARWGRGLARSWRLHRGLLAPAYTGGVAVCIVAAVAGEGMYYYADFRDGGGRFSGLMSLASSFCLVAFGWSMLAVSARGRDGRDRLPWALAGIGGVWLAFDEAVQLHETFGRTLARAGVPAPLGMEHDLYVFGAYGLIAAWLFARLRPRRPGGAGLSIPATVAVACFATSQALDGVPWDAVPPGVQPWWGAAEEGFTCIGAWSLALFGLILTRTPFVVAPPRDG